MDPWQIIVDAIKAEGVRFVFGLGDTSIQMLIKEMNDPALRNISLRYEGSAPFMAMAYARLSGGPGVCTASGPGTANMVPGILEAWSGCSPLIIPVSCTSQEIKGMGARIEHNQVEMMRPITKWSAHVPSIQRLPWFIRRAFSIALNGKPGPVFVEIPADVAGCTYKTQQDVGTLPTYIPVKRIRTRGDPNLISEAVDLLLESERPLALAGGGTIRSGAFEEFREFIELLGIPFQTTPSGRGIVPESHPLAVGLTGLYRTKVGKKYRSEADLIINIGSQNELPNRDELPQHAKFIQVDIDSFQIGRNWIPAVAVIGDAKTVLIDLVNGARKRLMKTNLNEIPRVKKIIDAKREYETEIEAECKRKEAPLRAKRIVRELNKVFGKNTILAVENGSQDLWVYYFPYYKVLDILGCTGMHGPTCMGMGVVGAIGAKLTQPDKKVVCTTGDGAFQMYMKELPTAVQYDAPCTWVVMNNFSLGWHKYYQEKLGYDVTSFEVQPDFVKLAEANRCFGIRVQRPSEITPALENALKANKEGVPAVLDFIIQTDMTHMDRARTPPL